jgi:hypothetical protein
MLPDKGKVNTFSSTDFFAEYRYFLSLDIKLCHFCV